MGPEEGLWFVVGGGMFERKTWKLLVVHFFVFSLPIDDPTTPKELERKRLLEAVEDDCREQQLSGAVGVDRYHWDGGVK